MASSTAVCHDQMNINKTHTHTHTPTSEISTRWTWLIFSQIFNSSNAARAAYTHTHPILFQPDQTLDKSNPIPDERISWIIKNRDIFNHFAPPFLSPLLLCMYNVVLFKLTLNVLLTETHTHAQRLKTFWQYWCQTNFIKERNDSFWLQLIENFRV